MTSDRSTPSTRPWQRLLGEPLVLFFALGVLLFVARRFVVSEPQTIVITSELRAELAQRYQDQHGERPSAAELDQALAHWKRDEALYREARREHLDQDDPTVRLALIEGIRARAASKAEARAPSDAELRAWIAAHRSLYETPLRYDFELVAFPRTDADPAAERDRFAAAVAAGKDAATLGRPVVAGNLTALELKGRVEPALALVIPTLPPGVWQRLDTAQGLALARVKSVTGGLPPRDQLEPRAVADWTADFRQRSGQQALERTVARYRFEEGP